MTDPKDGCSRECSEGHTYTWGRCELGVQPPPTLRASRTYLASDGELAGGFDTFPLALFLPWTVYLPPVEQHQMLAELADTPDWKRPPVLAAWRVTAEALADSARRDVLLGESNPADFVEAARPESVPPAGDVPVCSTPCDPDCDAVCHEDHVAGHKKAHWPYDCPAANRYGWGGSDFIAAAVKRLRGERDEARERLAAANERAQMAGRQRDEERVLLYRIIGAIEHAYALNTYVQLEPGETAPTVESLWAEVRELRGVAPDAAADGHSGSTQAESDMADETMEGDTRPLTALDVSDITPSGTSPIDQAVSVMREYAGDAANDLAGDITHCWDTECLGGIPRVIAIREFTDGTTDHEIVAIPLSTGLAEHVASWDPPTARAAATLLEAVATGADPRPAAEALARSFMNIHDEPSEVS